MASSAAQTEEFGRLSAIIATGNTEQKRDALFQIRNLRSEIAARIAIPALSDRDPIVRATAASSVIFLSKPDALAVLSPLLADRDAFVRKEAAYALGRIESPNATPALVALLLRERDLEVRAAAAIGLGYTGDPGAIEPLLRILTTRPSEENEFLRRAAARSIGQIAQIIRTGRRRVVTPENFLPEKFKTISGDELTAGEVEFQAAIHVLPTVLQNRREADDTRREAAFALGSIGGSAVRSVLESHRNSPDPYLSEIAREALLKIDAARN